MVEKNTVKLEDKATLKQELLNFNFPNTAITSNPKEWYDITKLSFVELQKYVILFSNKAIEESKKGNKSKASYYLLVMDRYMEESKLKIVIEV